MLLSAHPGSYAGLKIKKTSIKTQKEKQTRAKKMLKYLALPATRSMSIFARPYNSKESRDNSHLIYFLRVCIHNHVQNYLDYI